MLAVHSDHSRALEPPLDRAARAPAEQAHMDWVQARRKLMNVERIRMLTAVFLADITPR